MTGVVAPPAGNMALVAGTATGIGQAIAIELAGAGARVAGNHNHMPDGADTTLRLPHGSQPSQ
jgi:NAD(P)-dependent dehydrogenase (short-subunit alcohol dehydrogenase family)